MFIVILCLNMCNSRNGVWEQERGCVPPSGHNRNPRGKIESEGWFPETAARSCAWERDIEVRGLWGLGVVMWIDNLEGNNKSGLFGIAWLWIQRGTWVWWNKHNPAVWRNIDCTLGLGIKLFLAKSCIYVKKAS